MYDFFRQNNIRVWFALLFLIFIVTTTWLILELKDNEQSKGVVVAELAKSKNKIDVLKEVVDEYKKTNVDLQSKVNGSVSIVDLGQDINLSELKKSINCTTVVSDVEVMKVIQSKLSDSKIVDVLKCGSNEHFKFYQVRSESVTGRSEYWVMNNDLNDYLFSTRDNSKLSKCEYVGEREINGTPDNSSASGVEEFIMCKRDAKSGPLVGLDQGNRMLFVLRSGYGMPDSGIVKCSKSVGYCLNLNSLPHLEEFGFSLKGSYQ